MAESQYIEHITSDGERWDTIAWKYYGDVSKMGIIIKANPYVPIQPIFPAGLKLIIPIIEKPSNPVLISTLPPWKT